MQMKTLIIALAFVFGLQGFAQELQTQHPTDTLSSNTKEDKKGRQLLFNIVSRIYATLPGQFGDHALADAHRSKVGFGTTISLLEYKNIRLTGGHEIGYYTPEDVSRTANFRSTRVFNFFGMISYDFKLNDGFTVVPGIGYGYSNIKQRYRTERHTHQDGEHFRVGFSTDYSLNKHFALFLGIYYIDSKFEIITNPAYEDYFGKSRQVQFTLGIKIH